MIANYVQQVNINESFNDMKTIRARMMVRIMNYQLIYRLRCAMHRTVSMMSGSMWPVFDWARGTLHTAACQNWRTVKVKVVK